MKVIDFKTKKQKQKEGTEGLDKEACEDMCLKMDSIKEMVLSGEVGNIIISYTRKDKNIPDSPYLMMDYDSITDFVAVIKSASDLAEYYWSCDVVSRTGGGEDEAE